MVKRNRGGQQGNQNARTHGFYSSVPLIETAVVPPIAGMEAADPEIAAFVARVRSSLQRAPGNRRIIAESVRLLTKWYSARHNLGRADSHEVRHVIVRILESYADIALVAKLFSGKIE